MRRPVLRQSWLLLAAGLFLLPRPVHAQEVRGEVVQRSSGDPIAGALVELRDDGDSTVDQTVTGASGHYLLSAPEPGTYRLRVERIGYRSWTSDPLELAADTSRSVRAEVPVQAVRLSDLAVSASRQCRTSPSESRRTARIWEETRKALESVRFTNRRGLLRFRIREFRRQADRQMDVIEESSHSYVAVGRHPFQSLSATDLSEEGYVRSAQVDGESVTDYFAPDAAALVSDEFMADHCFRVAGREDGMLGLAFRPAEDREKPDVAGTFWLDPHTAQLRRLTYRYANLDLPRHEHRIGGRVEFLQLPEGSLIVRRWWIRMPRLGRSQLRVEDHVRFGQEAVTGYDVVGGRVLEVYGPRGDTLRTAETAALVGTVRRQGSGEPLAGATVQLRGTDRQSATDDQGYFRLDLLTGGRYELEVLGRLALAAGLEPRVRSVELEPGSSRQVDFELPDRETVRDRMCPDEPPETRAGGPARTAAVTGLVRDSTGEPVPKASVEVRWAKSSAGGLGAETPSGDRGKQESVVRRTTADRRGGYRLCHLPADRTLRLAARRDSAGPTGPRRELEPGDRDLIRADLEAPPAPDEAEPTDAEPDVQPEGGP